MINKYTWMNIAFEIAKSSKANNHKVGAIMVKDGNIIAIGYNGTPSGFSNDCELNGVTKPEVLHAESNAIAKCATANYSSKDSTMYCTLSPCLDCSKLIIQSGVKEVYYYHDYKDLSGLGLLRKAGIIVNKILREEYEV